MKILANWVRDFVKVTDDDRRLAERLTESGVAVEGFYNENQDLAYEAEITTNRPDAMNHYGVAREASAIYDVELKPIEKWEFYKAVATPDHVLTIQTGDQQRFANLLLSIGVRME